MPNLLPVRTIVRFIDGFRDPAAAKALVKRVRALGEELDRTGRSATFMEVCGSHTMAIARYAIRQVLPETVSLVSGPGCPVCVTPPGYLDAAIQLAARDVILVTFGDMLRVPGSETSLAATAAGGADVRVVYSPLDAVGLAEQEPGRQFVFLAIGFETTIAPVVSIVREAEALGLENISLLTAFKTIPPALDALLADPDLEIDGFLCPAHVSAIIGAEAYRPYAEDRGIPCVIAGFEPLDILLGVEGLIKQVLRRRSSVDNQYSRVVTPTGNQAAWTLIEHYLEPADDQWRGLGTIPMGGMRLRKAFADYDAVERFSIRIGPGREKPGCRCGDVVKGKLIPDACPLFGKACRPECPVGPCMVSAEGTCAAYFKYSRRPEGGLN